MEKGHPYSLSLVLICANESVPTRSLLTPLVFVIVHIVFFIDWSVNQKDFRDLQKRVFRLRKRKLHCSSIYMVCNQWRRNSIKEEREQATCRYHVNDGCVCIVVVNKRRQERWNSPSSSSSFFFYYSCFFKGMAMGSIEQSLIVCRQIRIRSVDRFFFPLSLSRARAFFLEQYYLVVKRHNFWSDAMSVASS